MLAPDQGEAIAVQTNSARGGLLHQDVTTWWQRQRLNLKVPEPVYIELDRTRYAEYADRYLAELSDAELELADTYGSPAARGHRPGPSTPAPDLA